MLWGPLTPSTRVQPKPHLGNPHMGIANSEIKQVFVLGTWHFLKWDARGLIVPLLVPCRDFCMFQQRVGALCRERKMYSWFSHACHDQLLVSELFSYRFSAFNFRHRRRTAGKSVKQQSRVVTIETKNSR